MMEKPNKGTLQNWCRLFGGRVCGYVYGHPEFSDGEYIITSRVVTLDMDSRKLETRNSVYVLGREYDW